MAPPTSTSTSLRSRAAWALVALGTAAVAVGCWGVGVRMALRNVGLDAISAWSLFYGGPVALVGALLALWKPRQRAASWLGLGALVVWIGLWAVLFVVYDF